jgi:hypothetical protein
MPLKPLRVRFIPRITIERDTSNEGTDVSFCLLIAWSGLKAQPAAPTLGPLPCHRQQQYSSR